MTNYTFGSVETVLQNAIYRLKPHQQKEAVLLLLERGMTKTEILRHTRLYSDEYEQLFDGTIQPFSFFGRKK